MVLNFYSTLNNFIKIEFNTILISGDSIFFQVKKITGEINIKKVIKVVIDGICICPSESNIWWI